MNSTSLPSFPADALLPALFSLPKAELHLHLEGAIAPGTVVELAARYGDTIDEPQVAARYATRDFGAFIEAYKWVTSYLLHPPDYALVAARVAEQLLAQNVVYAEVTLSTGVMLLRKQDVTANFAAIRSAVEPFAPRGLRFQWIFDTVRQFGAAAAEDVAACAIGLRDDGVVAFGIGGDELSVPTSQFRAVFEAVAASGLHRVAHAGEIGGPGSIREAVEQLGAERIGHGIAAMRDPRLTQWLADRSVALEICPTSNIRTGALALQLGLAPSSNVSVRQHPLPSLLRSGVPVSLSTDDPAMFETDLRNEYAALPQMGVTAAEILQIAENGFATAFLPAPDKTAMLAAFRRGVAALGLL